MARHRSGNDVTVILDASNTNPVCPDCQYRTVAIDACRCACRFCGQIVTDQRRVTRHLVATFAGRVVIGGQ